MSIFTVHRPSSTITDAQADAVLDLLDSILASREKRGGVLSRLARLIREARRDPRYGTPFQGPWESEYIEESEYWRDGTYIDDDEYERLCAELEYAS